MNNNEKSSFDYSYSSKERTEIENIRKKYTSDSSSKSEKLETLRKIDRRVEGRAKAVSITLGTLGLLTLGAGMSFIMSELATKLSIEPMTALAIGLILGAIGMIVSAIAYPVYKQMTIRARKKLAAEVLSLTDELLR